MNAQLQPSDQQDSPVALQQSINDLTDRINTLKTKAADVDGDIENIEQQYQVNRREALALKERLLIDEDSTAQPAIDEILVKQRAINDEIASLSDNSLIYRQNISKLEKQLPPLEARLATATVTVARSYALPLVDEAVSEMQLAITKVMVLVGMQNNAPCHHIGMDTITKRFMPSHVIDGLIHKHTDDIKRENQNITNIR